MNKETTTLYEHFKNTPKRLRIVCDWDEVIQPCEPFALWQAINKETLGNWTDAELWEATKTFPEYFHSYWFTSSPFIEYSLYGSKNKVYESLLNRPSYSERMERQASYKNSPLFYHLAPFLTIAEDLLKLIKESKIKTLIFLSAYDKRKFPNGDHRKIEMFRQTFYNLHKVAMDSMRNGSEQDFLLVCEMRLELIPFDSEWNPTTLNKDRETQGQSKDNWIKQNASNFDLVIDDNPNICKAIVENISTRMTVCSPYYYTIKHDSRVLLVKNEVSKIKKSGN